MPPPRPGSGLRSAREPTVSQIDELEDRLDTLTTAILMPLRASKREATNRGRRATPDHGLR